MKRSVTMCAIGALVVLLAGPAAGDNIDLPAKAKKQTFTLTNALPKCDTPDVLTEAFTKPACTYVKPDPTTECTMTPQGMGQLSFASVGKADKDTTAITAGTQDILIKISLKGMSKGCEGVKLFPFIERRRSFDDCNGGQTCILPDGSNIVDNGTDGCKVNEKGSCSFTISLNKTFPETFVKNREMNLHILRCGVAISGGSIATPPLVCGTFLP